jgi:hypothetical protein
MKRNCKQSKKQSNGEGDEYGEAILVQRAKGRHFVPEQKEWARQPVTTAVLTRTASVALSTAATRRGWPRRLTSTPNMRRILAHCAGTCCGGRVKDSTCSPPSGSPSSASCRSVASGSASRR